MQLPESPAETTMQFRHETIDDAPPSGRLGVCLPTDLTGDGYPDLVVGGMGAESVRVPLLGRVSRNLPVFQRLLWYFERDLFWYENPGSEGGEWTRHVISRHLDARTFACTLADVNGDGRTDVVVAQGWGGRGIYWFEQPEDPRGEWTRRLINDEFEVYHDITFGDVDNDGEPELVAASQESEVIYYVDVPEDPTVEPWPVDGRHVIAEGKGVEGTLVVDIDGDGRNELIAGPDIYRERDGEWVAEPIVEEWYWTRIAVADLDDDGDLEIVLTEGDSPHLPPGEMGRVAWFDRVDGDWEMHTLREAMFCPHSVQIADFDGDGRPDIYVAEMDLGENPEAEHVIFRNLGGGEFEEHSWTDVATHEAKAVDVDGDGRIDIIGKSYEPNHHVDVWYNVAGDREDREA